MRTIVLIFLCVFAPLLETSAQFTEPIVQHQFSHVVQFTINSSLCGTVNSSNFPCTIDTTLKILQLAGKGGVGSVTSVSGSDSIPNDVVFSLTQDFSTLLNWDVEYYSGTGNFIAKVNIPTLSASTNTVFFMGVGCTSITAYQGGATGTTYNSNYVAYYPLSNGTTLSVSDHTSNGYNGTITGATATAGEIDGAANFNGSNEYITSSSIPNGNSWSGLTVECWFNSPNTTSHENCLISIYNASASYEVLLDQDQNGGCSGCLSDYSYPTGTWVNSSTGLVVSNTWYYGALTWGSSGMIVYLNGVPVATNSTAYSYSNSYTFTTYFGSAHTTSGVLTGKLDEIMIQKAVATPSYIKARYYNTASCSPFLIINQIQ